MDVFFLKHCLVTRISPYTKHVNHSRWVMHIIRAVSVILLCKSNCAEKREIIVTFKRAALDGCHDRSIKRSVFVHTSHDRISLNSMCQLTLSLSNAISRWQKLLTFNRHAHDHVKERLMPCFAYNRVNQTVVRRSIENKLRVSAATVAAIEFCS